MMSPPKTKLKIAICQFDTHLPPKSSVTNTDSSALAPASALSEHEARNLEKVKKFVAEAAEKGAELVVFPEYFITGIIENHLHLASEEGRWIKEFQSLAVGHQIDIVAGTVVEREPTSQGADRSGGNVRLFNTAYYVNKSGEIVGRYRKKNLWHTEKYLTPCTHDHQVFDAGGFRVGMLICWDLAWPEAFRDLMAQKPDIIIIPSYWTLDNPNSLMIKHDPHGTAESSLLDSLVLSRALETECCVVYVNCGGKKEDGFLGRSSIAMPLTGHIIKFDDPDERLEVAEIDLSILDDAKQVYKVGEEYQFKKSTGFY